MTTTLNINDSDLLCKNNSSIFLNLFYPSKWKFTGYFFLLSSFRMSPLSCLCIMATMHVSNDKMSSMDWSKLKDNNDKNNNKTLTWHSKLFHQVLPFLPNQLVIHLQNLYQVKMKPCSVMLVGGNCAQLIKNSRRNTRSLLKAHSRIGLGLEFKFAWIPAAGN